MVNGNRSRRIIKRAFDRLAASFDAIAFLHDEVRHRLLERMELTDIKPGVALDLGSATGRGSRALAARYRRARIVAVDLSFAMARRARQGRWWRKATALVGNAERLPLRDDCIDLVFANLCLPYCEDPQAVLAEVSRVLRPGGLFAFSTLGPDSFGELGQAFRAAGRPRQPPSFPDMHIVGDALVQAGITDPVLDVEYLQIDYGQWPDMVREFRQSGAVPAWAAGGLGLGGATRQHELREHYPTSDADRPYPVTLELVFGHGWGSRRRGDGEVSIPVDSIRRPRW